MANGKTLGKYLLAALLSIKVYLLYWESVEEVYVGENLTVSLGPYMPFNSSKTKTIIQNQQERTKRIHHVCNTSHKQPVTAEGVKDVLKFTNIVVDDKHKVLYCYLPKVGCTSWKVKLVHATGLAPGVVLNTHPSVVDDRAGLAKFQLYMLSEYSPDQIKYRINNYFKFVFVRDPMERIVSAYRSKWEVRQDNVYERKYFNKYYLPEVVDTVRVNKSDRTTPITFEEFAKYLVYKSSRHEDMETHFERYHKLCHMCHIDYDFIGKFDTLIDDISFLIRRIFPNEKDYFFPNVSQPQSAATLTKKYFGQLGESLVNQLLEAYDKDMQLFGYSFDRDQLGHSR